MRRWLSWIFGAVSQLVMAPALPPGSTSAVPTSPTDEQPPVITGLRLAVLAPSGRPLVSLPLHLTHLQEVVDLGKTELDRLAASILLGDDKAT